MEAEAVNLGIQVAKNVGYLRLIIELDLKEVVDLSCNRNGSKSEIFSMIEAIRASLKSLNG